MKSRWVIGLGLAIVLAAMLLWRDDAPRVEVVDEDVPPLPFDDAETVEYVTPVTAPSPPGTSASASAALVDNGISDACEATVKDVVAFAVMEADAADPLGAGVDDAQFVAELENLRRRTLEFPGPDVFLTAFVLDRPETRARTDPSAQAPLLELGLRAADSNSALLRWHALRACVEAAAYCPFAHLEQRLLEGQEENADAWALAATLRYRRGDLAGALAAMQSAARAPTSTWYWTETSAVLARVLEEHTSMSRMERAGTALSHASTVLPPAAGVLQMCRAESVASQAWAEACLEFGRLQGERNETMLARALSYQVQEQALTAVGDMQGAEEVAEARALYRAESSAVASASSLLSVLIVSSSERFYAHLNAVRELGEFEGYRAFLRQELPTLLERAGLLERDGARECIAQFFEAPTAAGTTFRDYPIEAYPLQIGDELYVFVSGPGRSQSSALLRVGPDGTIGARRLHAIAAVGKTAAQLRSEIAGLASDASNPTPSVVVILMAPRSPEQRRIEFDEALREAREAQTR